MRKLFFFPGNRNQVGLVGVAQPLRHTINTDKCTEEQFLIWCATVENWTHEVRMCVCGGVVFFFFFYYN